MIRVSGIVALHAGGSATGLSATGRLKGAAAGDDYHISTTNDVLLASTCYFPCRICSHLKRQKERGCAVEQRWLWRIMDEKSWGAPPHHFFLFSFCPPTVPD